MNITRFIHSTSDGHFGCVQVVTIINKTNAFFFLSFLENSHSFSLSYMHSPHTGTGAGQSLLGGLAIGLPSPLSSGHVFSGDVNFVMGGGYGLEVGRDTNLLRLAPSLLASLPLAASALSLPDPSGGLARSPP